MLIKWIIHCNYPTPEDISTISIKKKREKSGKQKLGSEKSINIKTKASNEQMKNIFLNLFRIEDCCKMNICNNNVQTPFSIYLIQLPFFFFINLISLCWLCYFKSDHATLNLAIKKHNSGGPYSYHVSTWTKSIPLNMFQVNYNQAARLLSTATWTCKCSNMVENLASNETRVSLLCYPIFKWIVVVSWFTRWSEVNINIKLCLLSIFIQH